MKCIFLYTAVLFGLLQSCGGETSEPRLYNETLVNETEFDVRIRVFSKDFVQEGQPVSYIQNSFLVPANDSLFLENELMFGSNLHSISLNDSVEVSWNDMIKSYKVLDESPKNLLIRSNYEEVEGKGTNLRFTFTDSYFIE